MAGTASLSTVQTRLAWARQYTDELKQASREFMRDDPHANTAVDCKRDARVGRTAFVVHLPNGFPEDFGRLIGDAFHHLRSALDNLAYQLVLANGGTPTKATSFPILWDCKDQHFQSAAARSLEGMSQPARAALQQLQPFNEWPERPKDTTLWLINELNNIDKHRIPHLACLWIATCEGTLYVKSNSPEVGAADIGAHIPKALRRGVAEHGTTLLEFRWDPDRLRQVASDEVMVEFKLSADVGLKNPERTNFLDPDGQPTTALPIEHFLDAALAYCETTVLPAFAGEFE